MIVLPYMGISSLKLQGGSNMTGTDLCVNKPHCAEAVRPWEVKPQPPPSLLLGLEPVQSCLGVARVMSEQKVPRSVEQRIAIKFLVGEKNVPSAEIHHRLQQQYGEECLLRRHSSTYEAKGHTQTVRKYEQENYWLSGRESSIQCRI